MYITIQKDALFLKLSQPETQYRNSATESNTNGSGKIRHHKGCTKTCLKNYGCKLQESTLFMSVCTQVWFQIKTALIQIKVAILTL